jgi:phosphatidylglycerophosphate synthase
MFDRQALALLQPLMDAFAKRIQLIGLSANQMSFIGFGFGMVAAAMIAAGNVQWAVVPLLVNRLCDGLDGALARLEGPTDRGGFLDITLDFLFYAGIPLAFAFCDPAGNALAAATLLAAFIGTGISFLAYAVMAEKRGDKSTAYPTKSFYYLGGLTEGTETITCLVAMCLWPQFFAVLAYIYAAMCCLTTATRMAAGWQAFGGKSPK